MLILTMHRPVLSVAMAVIFRACFSAFSWSSEKAAEIVTKMTRSEKQAERLIRSLLTLCSTAIFSNCIETGVEGSKNWVSEHRKGPQNRRSGRSGSCYSGFLGRCCHAACPSSSVVFSCHHLLLRRQHCLLAGPPRRGRRTPEYASWDGIRAAPQIARAVRGGGMHPRTSLRTGHSEARPSQRDVQPPRQRTGHDRD